MTRQAVSPTEAATTSKGSRVTRGFAWNHVYKMVEYGGTSLYSILVMRKLGPEIGGNFAVYSSVIGTLGILAAFAVDRELLRYLLWIALWDSMYGHMMIDGNRHFLVHMFVLSFVVTYFVF